MKREWKPGDVAMVTYSRNGGERIMLRGCRGKWFEPTGSFREELAQSARPLVVIDPEDVEQVERLIVALMGRLSAQLNGVSKAQAALREFADPKPVKPAEPTGLEIRVWADGREWARVGRWWVCAALGEVPREWDYLAERDDFQIRQPLADWERDLLNGEATS